MKNQLYVKDQLVKCSICGQIATQDKYGNGNVKIVVGNSAKMKRC